jgi:NAD(P)-dependent dehydrogenase (short-subunit alcohol dehydrogenase family)
MTSLIQGNPMNSSATDLRVLVTAGAAGIGLAIATTFAEAGARVFVCDIDRDALQALNIARPSIGSSRTDVSIPAEVAAMFEEAISCLGGLHVLVNNVGITGPTAQVEEISVEDWDKTIATDLNSMFYCTRLAVPRLKAAGGGSIINLSSIAGRMGYPLRSAYAAAKWGVVGFTKSLAIELGPFNIRVNAIQPGVVKGERVNRVISARAAARGIDFDEALQQFVAPISLRRMVSAQDIANMALFLATPAGASISGQALSVCGGHDYLA